MQRDRPYARRILLTITLIVAIDAVVVTVLALFAYPWFAVVSEPAAAIVGPDLAPVVRWLVVFVPVLVAFIWAQLRFTRRALLADVNATTVTPDTHPDLHGRYTRLCKQANVSPPTLALADSDVPNSFAVGGLRDATVVVSAGLVATLSAEEVDAVLAHELAHVTNRDATVMTLASFLPALVSDDRTILEANGANLFVWLAGLLLAYVLASAFVPGPLFSARSIVGFVTLLAITILIGGLLVGVLTAPVVVLSRRLSETREFVADRAAAVITGNPTALATALETLDEDALDRPEDDARTQYHGADGLCLLPYGLDDTRTATPADRFVVETRSHPPTAERIAALRELERIQ